MPRPITTARNIDRDAITACSRLVAEYLPWDDENPFSRECSDAHQEVTALRASLVAKGWSWPSILEELRAWALDRPMPLHDAARKLHGLERFGVHVTGA